MWFQLVFNLSVQIILDLHKKTFTRATNMNFSPSMMHTLPNIVLIVSILCILSILGFIGVMKINSIEQKPISEVVSFGSDRSKAIVKSTVRRIKAGEKLADIVNESVSCEKAALLQEGCIQDTSVVLDMSQANENLNHSMKSEYSYKLKF